MNYPLVERYGDIMIYYVNVPIGGEYTIENPFDMYKADDSQIWAVSRKEGKWVKIAQFGTGLRKEFIQSVKYYPISEADAAKIAQKWGIVGD